MWDIYYIIWRKAERSRHVYPYRSDAMNLAKDLKDGDAMCGASAVRHESSVKFETISSPAAEPLFGAESLTFSTS